MRIWLAMAVYSAAVAGGGPPTDAMLPVHRHTLPLRPVAALRGGSGLTQPTHEEAMAMMEREEWVNLNVRTNETDENGNAIGPVDEVYGPPMIYPHWVMQDLDRAENGSLNAQVRLMAHLLSNASDVQWIWRNFAKEEEGDSNDPTTGGSQDLRDGAALADRLPDKGPWEDSAFEEEERRLEARAAKMWEDDPEECKRLRKMWDDMDDNGMYPYEKAPPDCKLFHSALEGDADEVKKVLTETGVDVNSLNWLVGRIEWTAVHCAASRGHSNVIAVLAEHGANMNHRASEGETAMHVAAKNGHADVISTLVEYGGNPMAVDHDGKMPFDKAQEAEQVRAAEVLYQYMDAEPAEEPV